MVLQVLKLCPEDFRSSAGGVVQKDKKGHITRHVLAALRKDIKLKVAKYNMCQVRALAHAAPLPGRKLRPLGEGGGRSLTEGLMGPCLVVQGRVERLKRMVFHLEDIVAAKHRYPPSPHLPTYLITPLALPQVHMHTEAGPL